MACSDAHPEIIQDVMKMPAIPVDEVVPVLHSNVLANFHIRHVLQRIAKTHLSKQFMFTFQTWSAFSV